jgi:mannose-6-phosphate isomerase-like protein (cupin superfamily)
MSLERHSLGEFTGGWFVGQFEPTLIPSDAVEVAVKHYRAGEHEPEHHHRLAVEVTVIVAGRVRMAGREFAAGDIVRILPGESTDFTALTDATTTVVKMPSVAGDKFPGPFTP